jgi:hypothetical protein
MKHKHHIIPRHMGGTDDPSNLIELTPAEHAEAHKKLYEEHGRWQDYVAWQGLARLSEDFDAAKESIIRGAKQGSIVSNARWKDPEHKAKRVAKFKKSMEGKWPYGRIGSSNPSSKEYLITHPDGRQEQILSLKLWCDINGLKYNTVFNVCVGRGKSHKGYLVSKLF